MELTEEVLVVCRKVAHALWGKVHYHLSDTTLDREDFLQQAYLLAWLLPNDRERTPNMVATTLRTDMLDWLRQATGFRHKGRPHGRGIFDSVEANAEDYGQHIADPNGTQGFYEIERLDALRRAFEAVPGRGADIARMRLAGASLQEIGDHYGVTESRACQLETQFIRRVQRAWGRTDEHGRLADGA